MQMNKKSPVSEYIEDVFLSQMSASKTMCLHFEGRIIFVRVTV